MTAISPFTIPFSHSICDDLRTRLRQTRWPDEIAGSEGAYGFDRGFLQDLCAYWADAFDWEAQVQRFSAFPHYLFDTRWGRIHFIHVRGKGASPKPIILTHGWPGSFIEMLKIIPLLSDPVTFGLAAADSFDVVVPSLPGFGFSDRPQSAGMNVFRVADIWVALMKELGYNRFAAQGGDLGAGVATALGLRHSEHIIGAHLNYIPGSYRPHIADESELTADERSFLADASRWFDDHGAYAHLQGTTPQTAAYALNDSPAGLAAWILEKFRDWSDCSGDLYTVFSRDELLANVMLYWVTDTVSSSFRMYYENRLAPLHFAESDFVRVPCAVACFPREIVTPPSSWVRRGYNLQRWTEMVAGGHFAAFEKPHLLASDIQQFYRNLK